MNELSYLYAIDGRFLLTPDAGVQMQFTDLDDGESGRDERGYMHRKVLRHKVKKWQFCYGVLSQEEYRYMRSVLSAGGAFRFSYPDPDDPSRTAETTAYLSEYGIVWQCAKSGLYRNLKFDVIEC
ncbi:MAG: hypothetical protein E7453_03440 [Ruminococcaceae bacterium]|nr:hypothetical protein [Oscillospiraceae bacterium]